MNNSFLGIDNKFLVPSDLITYIQSDDKLFNFIEKLSMVTGSFLKEGKLDDNFISIQSRFDNYINHINSFPIDQIKIIVIVDDEKMNLKSLKSVINQYKSEKQFSRFKIICVNDGIEALNLLYFDTIFFMKIDLVICDLNMKFLKGDTLFKLIKQINAFQNVKFAMYTNTDKETVECHKLVDYYLKKPCGVKDVEHLFCSLFSEVS